MIEAQQLGNVISGDVIAIGVDEVQGFIGTKLALPTVVFYCAYALLFLSAVNAKTDDVREYYRTVHPLLRVALSTATLASRDIVVTDARREPADYARMGLPTLDNSLHFVQKTGYVHHI